jgi:hypothetical protein
MRGDAFAAMENFKRPLGETGIDFGADRHAYGCRG